ncbi:MAG: glutaredoxin-like protein NrdH [Bdellovibrionaceae bacterium]|nr:glutaredoxin-like protein NrdH [Pseudobdellovibrionaceae bacterium]
MSVIVYSQPACVQCVATYKALEQKGIKFQIVDLTLDDEAMQRVRNLGYKQVPVVIAGDDHWSGFRPDKIGSL